MTKPTIPTWIRHDDGREMVVHTMHEYDRLISQGWWVTRNERPSSIKVAIPDPIEQPTILTVKSTPTLKQRKAGRPRKP